MAYRNQKRHGQVAEKKEDEILANPYCAIDNTKCDGICAKEHKLYEHYDFKTGITSTYKCPAMCSKRDIPLSKKVKKRLKKRKRVRRYSDDSRDDKNN